MFDHGEKENILQFKSQTHSSYTLSKSKFNTFQAILDFFRWMDGLCRKPAYLTNQPPAVVWKVNCIEMWLGRHGTSDFNNAAHQHDLPEVHFKPEGNETWGIKTRKADRQTDEPMCHSVTAAFCEWGGFSLTAGAPPGCNQSPCSGGGLSTQFKGKRKNQMGVVGDSHCNKQGATFSFQRKNLKSVCLCKKGETHQNQTGCLERWCGRRSQWPRPPPCQKLTLWTQIPEELSSSVWETPFPGKGSNWSQQQRNTFWNLLS